MSKSKHNKSEDPIKKLEYAMQIRMDFLDKVN